MVTQGFLDNKWYCCNCFFSGYFWKINYQFHISFSISNNFQKNMLLLLLFLGKDLGFTQNESASLWKSTPQKPFGSDKVTVTRLPAGSMCVLAARFFWVFRRRPGQASVSPAVKRQSATTRVQTVTVLLSDWLCFSLVSSETTQWSWQLASACIDRSPFEWWGEYWKWIIVMEAGN